MLLTLLLSRWEKGWKSVLQVAIPQAVRCWEAARGLMEASVEHRDTYGPGT